MSSRAARHRPRKRKAAARKRYGQESHKSAERARKQAEWEQAQADQRREHEAEQRHRERARWEMAPVAGMVTGAFIFTTAPSTGVADIANMFHPATHTASQIYSPVTPSRDIGGRPDPHPSEPDPTSYTPLWNASGTAVVSLPTAPVPAGLDSWGWAYVPNILGD